MQIIFDLKAPVFVVRRKSDGKFFCGGVEGKGINRTAWDSSMMRLYSRLDMIDFTGEKMLELEVIQLDGIRIEARLPFLKAYEIGKKHKNQMDSWKRRRDKMEAKICKELNSKDEYKDPSEVTGKVKDWKEHRERYSNALLQEMATRFPDPKPIPPNLLPS